MIQFLKYLSVLYLRCLSYHPVASQAKFLSISLIILGIATKNLSLSYRYINLLEDVRYNVSTFPPRLKCFGSFITSLNSTIVVISEFLNAWIVEREGLHGEIQEAMVINLINQVNEKLVKMACNYMFIWRRLLSSPPPNGVISSVS